MEGNNLFSEADWEHWNISRNKDVEHPLINKMSVGEFWSYVSKKKDEQGKNVYADISQLFITSLSVPHSNSDTGRSFSRMNFTKNVCKGSMSAETLEASMRTREFRRNCGDEYGVINPTPEIVRDVQRGKFYTKRKRDESEEREAEKEKRRVISDIKRRQSNIKKERSE